MNLFKSFTLTWWQNGLYKWSLLALGILVGMTWPLFFHAWQIILWPLFIIPAIYLSWLWYKQ